MIPNHSIPNSCACWEGGVRRSVDETKVKVKDKLKQNIGNKWQKRMRVRGKQRMHAFWKVV